MRWNSLTIWRALGNRLRQASVGMALWVLRLSSAVPKCFSSIAIRCPTAAGVKFWARAAPAMEPSSATQIRLSR
ncbi:hypothetical protein N8198_03305 [Gammaproteobacteria bacterium]|nr:hypothetical protein [Gammaproteobacteria bacterium]